MIKQKENKTNNNQLKIKELNQKDKNNFEFKTI